MLYKSSIDFNFLLKNVQGAKHNAERSIKIFIMTKVTVDIEMSCIFKEKFKLISHGVIYFKLQVKNQQIFLNSF